MAVIESFEKNENATMVSFVRFNKKDYFDWLDGKKDSQEHRAIWAGLQSNPSKQLQKRNQKLVICNVCKKEFLGKGKSKFCSNTCKQKNKNSKKEA